MYFILINSASAVLVCNLELFSLPPPTLKDCHLTPANLPTTHKLLTFSLPAQNPTLTSFLSSPVPGRLPRLTPITPKNHPPKKMKKPCKYIAISVIIVLII